MILDASPYVVLYPYFSNQAGIEPDGNAILYQAVYLAIKRRYQNLDEKDTMWVRDTYMMSQVMPGLITRGFHKKNEFQSYDDYLGLVYSSHISQEMSAAIDVYNYGKNNFWVFDNLGGNTIRAWFYRIPGFVSTIKLANRKKLSLFDQIMFFVSVAFNNNESGFQKSFIKIDMYKTQPYKYMLLEWGCKLFEKRIAERYDQKMGGVFRIYYGKDHLFTKWMQGRM